MYDIVRSSTGKLKPNPTPKAVKHYRDGSKTATRASRLINLLMAIQRSRKKPQIIGCRVAKREVTVLLKKHLNQAYKDAPTLILSATANPLILCKWWRHLKPSKAETPVAPHETVVQFKTKATIGVFTKGRLMKQVIAAVRRFAYEELNTGGGGPDGLVVLQKAPAAELKEAVPSNVTVANFGAMAGINTFENVGFQVIIGRPLPHPSVSELIAEVIKEDVIDRKDVDFYMGWYPKRTVPIDLKKGGTGVTKAEWHPDPIAGAILDVMCIGEVVQANRGRGLHRTKDNPLMTIYINEQPAPVPVDHVIEGLPFGPIDIMVGKGLVVDARACKGHWQIIAKIVAEWFETPQAARRHFEQAASNVLSNVLSTAQSHISTLYGFGRLRENTATDEISPPTVPFDDYVHAKITMAGQRYGVPVFISSAHGTPEEHATNLLGPLKKFEILSNDQLAII